MRQTVKKTDWGFWEMGMGKARQGKGRRRRIDHKRTNDWEHTVMKDEK